jgi:CelD/BcsL family acetyltransferase involved in cellulose biosynthesis
MYPHQHSASDASPVHNCQILKSIGEVIAIKSEWERLWLDARAGYSLSFSYCFESWNTIHHPQGAELYCAVSRDGARLLAVLPMVLLRGRLELSKRAVVCSPEAAEGCDILITRTPESQVIAIALLKNFLMSARPDVVSFFFVKSGSHLDTAVRSITSLRIVSTGDDVMPYADLKAEVDWDSYKRSRSKHYERNVARKTRRLQELGKLTAEVVRDVPMPTIEWLFQQKKKWSARTKKRGHWICSSRYQEFITKLFASDPRFLIFALKLDDTPIAVKLAAIGAGFASTMMISYNDEYERFSPGNVLDEFMMRHIFEQYRDSDGRHLGVDFGPGEEHFKLHWSRGNVHQAKNFIMTASRSGWARFRFDQTCGRIQRLISRFLRTALRLIG